MTNDPRPTPPRADDTREALLARGLPLVRRVAFRLARRLPPNVDVRDLISAGTVGLLRAIDSFDPRRMESFEPYVESRIRGAVLDELRVYDPMTRHGRRKLSMVAKVIRTLEQELGRAPADDEIACRLGVSIEEYFRLAEEFSKGPALARGDGADPDGVVHDAESPFDDLDDKERRQRLASAIRKLPERAQTVLALYYQEECTQSEIGRILDVTESRVCQILGDAVVRLRSHLEAPRTCTSEARRKFPKGARSLATNRRSEEA